MTVCLHPSVSLPFRVSLQIITNSSALQDLLFLVCPSHQPMTQTRNHLTFGNEKGFSELSDTDRLCDIPFAVDILTYEPAGCEATMERPVYA